MPNSTVLSTTWPEASLLALPGGRPGTASRTTSGVATTLTAIQMIISRRKWEGSCIVPRASDHVEEAVHVADRLHRSREPIDEPGRAGHEALPAEAPWIAGANREGHRLVGLLERARHLGALVLRVVGHAEQRHGDPELRHREGVRGVGRIDDVRGPRWRGGSADPLHAADRA